MERFRTLWIDASLSVKESELPPVFRERCETTYCVGAQKVRESLQRDPFELICFDFDFPDRASLRLLRETKADYASIPIVMLTVQHSEALAIWAFRSRVWDYLVKPIPKHEAERCLTGLERAFEARRAQTARVSSMWPDRIPDEVSFKPPTDNDSLAPALYYVEAHFRSRIRGEEMAALCKMSPFRFSRLFKETFGLTFRDHLIRYRIKEACRLLENPSVCVADVAFAVGFTDPSYFARVFKQRVGKAPSELVGQPLADIRLARELLAEGLPQAAS
jgi:YesN/AraC family two-component response regulator